MLAADAAENRTCRGANQVSAGAEGWRVFGSKGEVASVGSDVRFIFETGHGSRL
jgi:hypothetical protein